MNFLWTVIFFFAPLPVLLLVGQIRVLRQRKATAEQADTPKPFDPQPDRRPIAFLRHFTSIERTYLSLQFPTARIGFYISVWLTLAVMLPSLLPQSVQRDGTGPAQPLLVWYSFLHAAVNFIPLSIPIAMFTAIAASFNLTGPQAQSQFNFTRPIKHKLLFWGRVLPALVTLLVSYGTALLLSFLMLLVFYGPVWKHLYESNQPLHMAHWQAMQFVALIQSPSKVFFSIAASMVFLFSTIVLLILQPFQAKSVPKPFALLGGLLIFEAYNLFGSNRFLPRLAHLGLAPIGANPPPPWSVYLIPLAVSAILLWLAELSIGRKQN